MRKLLILIVLLTLSACNEKTIPQADAEIVPRTENEITQLHFSVGDEFKEYEILNSEGTSLDVSEISDKKTLIFFAWHLCPDCHELYEDYKEIFKTYSSNKDLSMCFIWDNEIPYSEFIGSIGINSEKHYTANDKYKFTENVPAYFVIDENDVITFKSTDITELKDLLTNEF